MKINNRSEKNIMYSTIDLITEGNMKYIKNEDELKNHLKEQIEFLIISSNSYDKGFKIDAKRLALAIR